MMTIMSFEASTAFHFVNINNEIELFKITRSVKVAVLFSGGKDSTYSIYKAKKEGHQVECVVTIFPQSYESELLTLS